MNKLNDEYLAGFFDADGSVGFKTKIYKDRHTLRPMVSFSQKRSHAEILRRIAEEYGVSVQYNCNSKGHRCCMIHIQGEKAIHFLERVKAHSVVRIKEIEFALAHPILRDLTKDEKKEYFRRFADVRKQPSGCTREKAAMRWVAGFVDGDGCISAWMGDRNYVQSSISVESWIFSQDGVKLLHKTFGGNLCLPKRGGTAKWRITVSGKRADLLHSLAENCIVKKNQAEIMRDYFDDGINHVRNQFNPRRAEYVEQLKLLKKQAI